MAIKLPKGQVTKFHKNMNGNIWKREPSQFPFWQFKIGDGKNFKFLKFFPSPILNF